MAPVDLPVNESLAELDAHLIWLRSLDASRFEQKDRLALNSAVGVFIRATQRVWVEVRKNAPREGDK